jgi:hypothetical protein
MFATRLATRMPEMKNLAGIPAASLVENRGDPKTQGKEGRLRMSGRVEGKKG